MRKKIRLNYKIKKERIKKRLDEFSTYYIKPVSWFYEEDSMLLKEVSRTDNERIFEELSFCLLTANTSAAMGMKAIDEIRPVLLDGSLDDLKKGLKNAGYRFPNKRAEYIHEAREKFRKNYDFDFKKIIESYDDKTKLRKFFTENVKGLGYKESSHFLRNIGVFGLAILDKHILRSLNELDVIAEVPKTLNEKRYVDIEKKYIEFSENIGINMDELDLLLWSMKNGKIMK